MIRSRLSRWSGDPAWTDAVAPTLAIRGVVLLAGLLLVIVFRPEALPTRDLLEIWNHWDAPHFLELARGGYGAPTDPARIVLFPLYPALIALGSVLVQPLVAGMLISLIASVAAAVGLYRLTVLDSSRPVAASAVVAMSVFPTAFAFVAPYSEALFLALAVWALLAGRTGQWQRAGILGMLAAATRLQGIFLFPALVFAWWLGRRRAGADLAWLGLIPLGLASYLAINQVVFGNPLHFLAVQEGVFRVTTIAPWDAAGRLVTAVLGGTRNEGWLTVYAAPLAAELALAAAVLWTARSWRRRPAEFVYGLLTLVLVSTLSWPISLPRYVLGVPAVFSGVATLVHRVPGGAAVMVLSTILFGIFTTLFVIGHWAS